MSRYAIRRAEPVDAAGLAAVFARSFEGLAHLLWPGLETPEGVAAALQTGSEMLVAEDAGGAVVAAVRFGSDEGVLWFDSLGSIAPGAGRALVRAVERLAQERGLRQARTRIPSDERTRWVFQRWGFVPVAREGGAGRPETMVVERRLPLLTVREQRRADAHAIAALTGEDPWLFEQGARPGWFVLSDGERVAGVVAVREGRGGVARVAPPVLADGYQGRGLELWMLDVALRYAGTGGYHTAILVASPAIDLRRRDLEDRRWQRQDGPDGACYVRALGDERGVTGKDIRHWEEPRPPE